MNHTGGSDLLSPSLETRKLIPNLDADIDNAGEESKERHFLAGASLSQRILPEYIRSAKGGDG